KPENLRLLTAILKEAGYIVRQLRSGKRVMASALDAPPDLILLDIMMPETDGYEVCRGLKAEERTCDIPVIFISALEDVANKIKGFSVGGADYITKPFREEEVLVRVKTHLGLRLMQNRLEEQNARLRHESIIREQALEALKKQKEFNEKIVQTSNALIVGLDKNHKIKIFNKGAEKITGFKSKEVIDKDWFEIFFEPDIYDEMSKVWEIAWGANFNSYVNPILSKNDDKKIISWQATGMYDDADENRHMLISIGEDITERTRAEKSLKESREKYRSVVENANDIITVNQGDVFKFINPKVLEISGYSEADLMSRSFIEIVHPDDRQMVKQRYLERLNTQKCTGAYELRILTKDGSIKWFESRADIIDWEGKTATLNVLTDITDRKLAENALAENIENLEQKIKERTEELQEMNVALKVLLKKRDDDKKEMEEKIFTNYKSLISPFLQKLKRSLTQRNQQNLMDIVESNLKEFLLPFSQKLSDPMVNLTPTEIQIASMVKQGLSNKEMAQTLNSSIRTITNHRQHIRMKLGLKNKKINLQSFLSTLQ
ncbi:MAG: PAS domain S-box protein, partial [Desulfobacterales bacterium]|nr:PAS domain S-box protein [Desulfobacterales bacterium]